MHSREEIAPGVHLLSSFNPQVGITFNQYFLVDEQPTLVSSGYIDMVDDMRRCIDEVADATKLRYIVAPHFEADECGALTTWQGIAAAAEPIVGAVCSRQLSGFGLTTKFKQVNDGDVVSIGAMRLRALTVGAEMHLWDGIIVFEESQGILFSSDFFSQFGEQRLEGEAFTNSLVKMYQMTMPSRPKTEVFIDKVRDLPIRMIAPGHGFVITENINAYIDAIAQACLA